MNKYKVLGFVILFLFSLNIVSATIQDDLRSIGMNSYYAFENNSINDETGNFSGATTNSLNTSGILGSGRSFNGAAQKVDLATLGVSNGANPWTVNLWIKTNTLAKTIYSMGTSGTRNNINMQLDGVSDRLRLSFSGGQKTFVATGIDDNTFHMVTCLFNGTTVQDHTCYMDGTLLSVSSIGSSTGAMNYANSNYGVGYFSATATQFFLGTIDEVSIWSRQLDQTEISYLYNLGTPTIEQRFPFISTTVTPTLTIDNINLVNDTITNSNSLNIALNISQTNSNTNINTTLFLSNGSSYPIGTNTQNVSFTLNNIQENIYNIWTYSINNETNTTSTNFTYEFDFTNPVINNNINLTFDSYTIALNSSCSDVNLDYCNISIDGQIVSLNSSSITLTHNGNISYTITALDLAGNSIIENGNTFIDPKIYFYFNDTNGDRITNFNFDSISYIEFATLNIYDLGLGNHTLIFDKATFQLTNVSFTLTNTSIINLTTIVGFSQLNINVFDRDTLLLLSGRTILFTLLNDNGGSVFGANFSTTTGTSNFINSSFLSGTYLLTANTEFFSPVEFYFTYSGQENATINLYMVNASKEDDIGDLVIVPVKMVIQDAAGFDVGNNAIVKILQRYASEDGATFQVDSSKTNANGEVLFNLEFNSIFYSVLIEHKGTTTRIDTFKITKFGTNCNLGECYFFQVSDDIPSQDKYFGFDNIDFNLRFINLSNTTGYLQFTFNNKDNLVNQFCLDVFEKTFFTYDLINTSCLTQSSGTINTLLNNTNSGYFKGVGYFYDDNNKKIILGTKYVEATDLTLIWGVYGLVGTIILFFTVLGIGSYAASKNIEDAPGITLAGLVGVFWATDKLGMVSWGYTILFSVTFIIGIIVWLLYRRK